jgi:hypothetical protein
MQPRETTKSAVNKNDKGKVSLSYYYFWYLSSVSGASCISIVLYVSFAVALDSRLLVRVFSNQLVPFAVF